MNPIIMDDDNVDHGGLKFLVVIWVTPCTKSYLGVTSNAPGVCDMVVTSASTVTEIESHG